MKIIFDTSFLLECSQNGRSGFEEAEKLVEETHTLAVPKPIFDELKSIASKRGGKKPVAAKLILNAIEKRGEKIVFEKTEKRKGDDAIREIVLREAEKGEAGEFCVVCSNDYDLRKSLRKKARFLCVKKGGKVHWC